MKTELQTKDTSALWHLNDNYLKTQTEKQKKITYKYVKEGNWKKVNNKYANLISFEWVNELKPL